MKIHRDRLRDEIALQYLKDHHSASSQQLPASEPANVVSCN
jgi:hypothetical protein